MGLKHPALEIIDMMSIVYESSAEFGFGAGQERVIADGLGSLTDRVRGALGSPGLELSLVTAGASRVGYVVSGSSGDAVAFLRLDDGTSGLSGTSYDLAREARILREVRARGLPVPEVLGILDDPPGLILEYIEGTNAPSDDDREAVGRAYMQVLAQIHDLPPDILGDPVPDTAREAISQDLQWWRAYAARTGVGDRPLLSLALRTLEASRFEAVAPPQVVHGDAGAGNLLAVGSRLVAVLDWEMAHLGERHEDLAWVWLRAVHSPFGSLPGRMDEYAQATGLAVDNRRVRWQFVFVLTKTAIALAVALERHSGRLGSLHHTLWTVYATILLSAIRGIAVHDSHSIATVSAEIAAELEPRRRSDHRAERMLARAADLGLMGLRALTDD